MAYTKKRYVFRDSTEVEYTYRGQYGARGEPRQKKKKATPEQMAKQNMSNKRKAIRRLIKANFSTRDYWVTLKYKKGSRPTMEQVAKDWDRFIRRLKSRYKKAGADLKWIRRLEIGKRGGIHAHVILNRIEGLDLMIRECWGNPVYFETLYGDFEQLADYLAKDEAPDGQMSMFNEKEKKRLKNYSHSRNLVKVEPITRVYQHWTMRRILRDGPKPSKGYYIVKDSIRQGINPYTGMSYLSYTEAKLERKERMVNIYLSISNRAPNPKEGVGGYVIAVKTDKGDATLTNFVNIPAMSKNQAELYTLNSALGRLTGPCYLSIYTDSSYLAAELNRLEDRAKHRWKKRDGSPIQFVENWKKCESLIGGRDYEVRLKEKNEYGAWLSDTVKKLNEKLEGCEDRESELKKVKGERNV